MYDPWFGLPRIQWEIFKRSSVMGEPLVRAQPFWGEIGWRFGPDLEWQVGHQTSLWSWRAEEASWRSVGLSEAEDWLGREASRPWEDPEGCLYRKQAMAKKRKPSTLYASPATSKYQLMAAFWYTKQEPCRPHWACQSRHALSITQPKAMGPGMPPRVLTTIHWIPSAKDLCWSQTHRKVAVSAGMLLRNVKIITTNMKTRRRGFL